jgi:hypothetical protein
MTRCPTEVHGNQIDRNVAPRPQALPERDSEIEPPDQADHKNSVASVVSVDITAAK